jgi:type VI protein secretion system component VasF
MNKENISEQLMGQKSMLNVDAQKELIDHTLEASRKNAIKIFLTIFPIMLLTIFLIVGGILYFARSLH